MGVVEAGSFTVEEDKTPDTETIPNLGETVDEEYRGLSRSSGTSVPVEVRVLQ